MKECCTPDNLVEFARSLRHCKISGEESKRRLGRFLEQKARERSIPIHGTFELTPFCNLDCKMCYVHLDNESFSTERMLAVQDWKAIIEQAYQAGMRKATFTGGECLTYSGFDDLFLFLRRLGIDVSVLTNGILIDQKRIDLFKRHQLDYIQVSLYGSNEDAYEKVTGHRMFGRVIESLRTLRDSGIKVQVTITPNRFMHDDIRSLIELVNSLNIPYEINCRLIPPRENTGRAIEDLTLDQYVEVYRIRAEMIQTVLYPADATELPDENHNGTSHLGFFCGAGRSSFAINYEGYMMPCVSLDDYSVSIKEIGFRKAWKLINEYSVNYPTPCECNGCVYFPVCIHCQALHKTAPTGHCDRSICERTRKLAEAGFFHYIGHNKVNRESSQGVH